MAGTRQTFFLPVDDGQRLCIYYPPVGKVRGRVLHVPPFAEEMNKARRMTALQAATMAQSGYAVLQMDLLGCGDSSGDFGDATWDRWLADLELAHRWLAHRTPGPDWLWGLRAGCLLATELGARLDGPCNYLFWQPASSGNASLQQFLRLKLAGDMIEGTAGRGMAELKQNLARGQAVEIAGYRLSPGLARGLEASELRAPSRPGRLEWLELSTREDATLTPVAAKTLTLWQAAGHTVRAQVVPGPSFWQTSEIEDAPALLEASVAALAEGASA